MQLLFDAVDLKCCLDFAQQGGTESQQAAKKAVGWLTAGLWKTCFHDLQAHQALLVSMVTG